MTSYQIKPYNNIDDKKEQIVKMFNHIASKYDLLNHILSVGIDILWRKKAIKQLISIQPKKILDIATGTGDFAIEAVNLRPSKIIGVDISEKMLEVGKNKIKSKKLDKIIELYLGDSENLPFQENQFDAITVAFGVRNFENLKKGISEMYRVLSNGGKVVIIEFSKPQKFPVKQLYTFYFKFILPFIGKIISKDNKAYNYLRESVEAFPCGDEFLEILKNIGFKNNKVIFLTFGIASIYIGEK